MGNSHLVECLFLGTVVFSDSVASLFRYTAQNLQKRDNGTDSL